MKKNGFIFLLLCFSVIIPALLIASPGTDEYVVTQDGELIVEPYLTTYYPAAFHVYLDDEEIVAWVRNCDIERELCYVNGLPDENSMFLYKVGDYSPTEGLSYSFPVKEGQVITARREGNYLDHSYLRISGPVSQRSSLDSVLGPGSSGSSTQGSGSQRSGNVVQPRGRGFLWKPISENTGKCVVLLPSAYRQEDTTKQLWVNGSNEVERWRPGYANGNRVHIYLKRRGADYDSNINVEVGLTDGTRVRWNIPNGSRRSEQ